MNRGSSFLFILKSQQGYSEGDYSYSPKSGLSNSVKFVAKLLQKLGRKVEVETVVDGNCIDRVVAEHRPSIVVIEALWVTPAKLQELSRLHPKVKWVVRIHSEIPFLANEGIAMDWLLAYTKIPNVFNAANSSAAQQALWELSPEKPVFYLPNYYGIDEPTFKLFDVFKKCRDKSKKVIDIGCFGAIRPMKNQLIQAIAAVTYADQEGLKLRFHMNASRLENSGAENVLKNIRGVFNANPKHELVEHGWLTHEDFIKVIAKMDLMLQVSMSETFNIVTADAIAVKVPVVVGPTIDWVSPKYQADFESASDIVCKIRLALDCGYLDVYRNLKALYRYNQESKEVWAEFN
jgi:glycosyltransferase involved in cell wall biosynthesis